MAQQKVKRTSRFQEGGLGLQGKIIGWVEQAREDGTGRNVGYIVMNRVYEFTTDGRAILRGFVDSGYAYERNGEERGRLIGRVRYYDTNEKSA